MLFCLLEPHGPEVFHNLLGLCPQSPKRVNSTPPGFLLLVPLNVALHMTDPEQASKLPVCSGLIDGALKSRPRQSPFLLRPYSLLFRMSACVPHRPCGFPLSPFLLFPPTPPSPLWAQKHTYTVNDFYFKRDLKSMPLETVDIPLGKIFKNTGI